MTHPSAWNRATHACVVVSNDLANRYGQPITVVPTQRYTAERAGRAYMVDLRGPRSNIAKPRVANASMIMTYDRTRVVKRAGRIGPAARRALDATLALHLDLASGDRAPAGMKSSAAIAANEECKEFRPFRLGTFGAIQTAVVCIAARERSLEE